MCPKPHPLTQSRHPFRITPYLLDRACLVGQAAVFDEAETMLAELLQVSLSAKQIERVCHHFGHLLDDAPSETEDEAPSASEPEAEADERRRAPVYAMVDGSMVLTREAGWKEIKLGRVFTAEAHEPARVLRQVLEKVDDVDAGQPGTQRRRGRILESVYTAHLGPYTDFLPKWERELTGVASQALVFIADGAAWFWDWASEAHPEAEQILDYYHAKGYLARFAKVYFKDKSERAAWIECQEKRLFADQVEVVIEEIEQLRHRGVEDLVERGKILSYYRSNQTRMRYGRYRARGLLIGSGPIEAAHRNVIQQRLKLAGQRWTQPGAQQVANLRVLRKSGRWDNIVALTRTMKVAA